MATDIDDDEESIEQEASSNYICEFGVKSMYCQHWR